MAHRTVATPLRRNLGWVDVGQHSQLQALAASPEISIATSYSSDEPDVIAPPADASADSRPIVVSLTWRLSLNQQIRR
ncbi:hypothetical protein [Streptomyces chartreusis]|uniref:hypothetical protein n=1 Tax=Streptomyces chartreusis TaxID=1969 RepID=UPI00379458E1